MSRKTAIYIVIIVFVFFIVSSFIVFKNLTPSTKISKKTFLVLNLSGVLKDYSSDSFIISKSRTLTLWDIYNGIERAKKDNRIKGILIKISPGFYASLAQLEEITHLIKQFRKSGKKVFFYISYAGKGSYYLSSSGDKIYIDPVGEILLNGFAFEVMFYKNFFNKIGVKADFLHIGEYKTASNIYTEDKLTPHHREMLEQLIETIFSNYKNDLRNLRGFKLKDINEIFKRAIFTPEAGLSYKLVDEVKDFNSIKKELKNKGYEIVNFKDYLKPNKKVYNNNSIAVIFLKGTINIGGSGEDPLWGRIIGASSVEKIVDSILSRKNIKAVVLRVDSPGGSVLGSDQILRSFLRFKEKKIPFVVSMGSVSASGGYWISVQADKIIADKYTFTGSIGVLGGKFVLKGLYEKLGLNVEEVSKGSYPLLFSASKEFSEEEKKIIYNELMSVYKKFLDNVSKGRKMSVDEVDRIARGRVWMGVTAKKLNLVDEIGGIDKAIEEASKLAGLKNYSIVVYPRKRSLFDKLAEFGIISDIFSLLKKSSLKYREFMFLLLPDFVFQLK